MKLRLFSSALFAGLWLWSTLALAGVEQISEKDFRDLAAELAPKVNLFQAGWAQDPKAEFYGGTTRDYLYWLKGQFLDARTPGQAEAIVAKLKALPVIDVRDFIIGDSDVDVISARGANLRAEQFGVRKIDSQSLDILNPATEAGQNEILQGYIPAEKIRLAKSGFPPTTLGDGIHEIYEGKLSVHFASAEDFAKSKYAKEGINHPVLLAVRYLRLQAINYYRTHGGGVPDKKLLLSGMDEASAKAVKEVIDDSREPHVLDAYLAREKFKSWINGGIQKAFRSYTNPTAALELMRKFGVDKLPDQYKEIETLNQYVFSKYRDEKKIAQAFNAAGVDPAKVYIEPSEYFPDGKLYHGTRDEASFRSILFQGVLPSEHGSGGRGLYGVAEKDRQFSEQWRGNKDLLMRFTLAPKTKIIDITKGEGEKLWRAAQLDEEEFAERFGADILRYPYDTQAFVVKNGAVLKEAEGVHRKVMSLGAFMEATAHMNNVEEILSLMSTNQLSLSEAEMIWKNSKVKAADVAQYLVIKNAYGGRGTGQIAPRFPKNLLGCPYWQDQPEVQAVMRDILSAPYSIWADDVLKLVLERQNPTPESIAFADGLVSDLPKNEPLVDQLLDGPLGRQPHTPNAVKHVLNEIENEASGKGKSAPHHLFFLAQANLGDQTERAWKIYRKLGGIQPNDLGVKLAASLLHSGSHVEEIQEKLFSEIAPEMPAEKILSRTQLLADYFPTDARLPGILENFTKKHFGKIAQGHFDVPASQFSQIANKIGAPQSVKDEIFDVALLANANGETEKFQESMRALELLPLSESEWIRFFEHATPEEDGIENFLRQPHDSAELSRALIDSYVTFPAIGRDEPAAQLARAINADSKPEVLEKYFLEALADGPNIRLEKLANGMSYQGLKWPKNPEVTEAILRYLERNYPLSWNSGEEGPLLHHIKVEDPIIAERLQKMFLGKSGNPQIVLFAHTIDRMPRFSPEFREFLQKQLKAHEHTKNYDRYLLTISRALARDATCAQSFGLLGGGG